MKARLPQDAEMLLRLGEGGSPTESMGPCLTVPHSVPKTLRGFEAMAISRGKMCLFCKQILKNGIAIRCCSLPAVFSFQESSSSCGLVGWPGQISLFTVILRYVPEPGSNSMGLEQPHLPKRRLCEASSCVLGFGCSIHNSVPQLLFHTGNPRARHDCDYVSQTPK